MHLPRLQQEGQLKDQHKGGQHNRNADPTQTALLAEATKGPQLKPQLDVLLKSQLKNNVVPIPQVQLVGGTSKSLLQHQQDAQLSDQLKEDQLKPIVDPTLQIPPVSTIREPQHLQGGQPKDQLRDNPPRQQLLQEGLHKDNLHAAGPTPPIPDALTAHPQDSRPKDAVLAPPIPAA